MQLSPNALSKLVSWLKKTEILGEIDTVHYGYDFIDQFMLDHGFDADSEQIKNIVHKQIFELGLRYATRHHVRNSLKDILNDYKNNQLFELRRYRNKIGMDFMYNLDSESVTAYA